MCYQIVQINFDAQSIPDDKLSDPENKDVADYGTRAVIDFTFPAEFLGEIALEQMFNDYERILAGDTTEYTADDLANIKNVFSYPLGMVQVHTGELLIYRGAPRPDLSAFETSDLTKLTYGLADLRLADPSTSTGLVSVRDRLESTFSMNLLGLSAEELLGMSDEYMNAGLNPETSGEDLDKLTESIAERIQTAIKAKLGDDVVQVGAEREPENPFGSLKLRG